MNKVEKAKLEKDGLDVYDALMRAAREGWETLDDNDVMRMKWYGLYSHNTKDGHFMLRTKVVQGVLTADQAEVMASIAEDFGREPGRKSEDPRPDLGDDRFDVLRRLLDRDELLALLGEFDLFELRLDR